MPALTLILRAASNVNRLVPPALIAPLMVMSPFSEPALPAAPVLTTTLVLFRAFCNVVTVIVAELALAVNVPLVPLSLPLATMLML